MYTRDELTDEPDTVDASMSASRHRRARTSNFVENDHQNRQVHLTAHIHGMVHKMTKTSKKRSQVWDKQRSVNLLGR